MFPVLVAPGAAADPADEAPIEGDCPEVGRTLALSALLSLPPHAAAKNKLITMLGWRKVRMARKPTHEAFQRLTYTEFAIRTLQPSAAAPSSGMTCLSWALSVVARRGLRTVVRMNTNRRVLTSCVSRC